MNFKLREHAVLKCRMEPALRGVPKPLRSHFRPECQSNALSCAGPACQRAALNGLAEIYFATGIKLRCPLRGVWLCLNSNVVTGAHLENDAAL